MVSQAKMLTRTPSGKFASAILALTLSLGCEDDEPAVTAARGATTSPATPQGSAPSPSSELAVADARAAGTPCGALACRRFPDATAALDYVLRSNPQILAVGEAHALAGREQVPTATERFEKTLLPELARRGASELVVELLNPAQGCTETVAKVRREQQPVVEKQDRGNQNRFVQLGHSARKLGVVPYILEPTCEEYQAVVGGGEDSIVRMLELIASKSEQKLLGFWRRRTQQEPDGSEAKPVLVLAYGGAMHNDVQVAPEKASFSFGKSLLEKTGGKYVALDLIVPETIRDSEVWKALPWYPHFDAKAPPREVTLFRPDEHSFVLIFGATTERNPRPSGTHD